MILIVLQPSYEHTYMYVHEVHEVFSLYEYYSDFLDKCHFRLHSDLHCTYQLLYVLTESTI